MTCRWRFSAFQEKSRHVAGFRPARPPPPPRHDHEGEGESDNENDSHQYSKARICWHTVRIYGHNIGKCESYASNLPMQFPYNSMHAFHYPVGHTYMSEGIGTHGVYVIRIISGLTTTARIAAHVAVYTGCLGSFQRPGHVACTGGQVRGTKSTP